MILRDGRWSIGLFSSNNTVGNTNVCACSLAIRQPDRESSFTGIVDWIHDYQCSNCPATPLELAV